MNADKNFMRPYVALLDAGFPESHVHGQLRRHLAGLQALPEGTEDREAAIAATQAFLTELEFRPGDVTWTGIR